MQALDGIEQRAAAGLASIGEGTIIGYAATWGTLDRPAEIWRRGAFATSLAKWRETKRWPPLLFNHDLGRPVGVIDDLVEDDVGLLLRGRLLTSTRDGRDVYEAARQGAVSGLSIGFRPLEQFRDRSGARVLAAVDLVEISIVAVPANERARLIEVRAAATGAASNNGRRIVTDHDAPGTAGQEPIASDVLERLATIEQRSAEVTDRLGVLATVERRIEAIERRLARPPVTAETRSDGDLERRAMARYLRAGDYRLDDLERRALRVSSDPAGGYLVDGDFLREIVRGATSGNPFRGLARVITGSSTSVTVPRQTGASSVSWLAETAEAPATEPTIGQIVIPAHRLGAYTEASQALLDDDAIDVAELLGLDLGERAGAAEAEAIVNGNGTGKPRGFLTYPHGTSGDTIEQVPSGSASALTAAGLVKLFYALKPQYRSNAVWVMGAGAIAAIRSFADTTGQGLWAPSLAPGQPETLLGRPVIEAPSMPTVAAGALPIAIADWRRALMIYSRREGAILRDPYSKARSGLVCFHYYQRFGASVVNFEAIKLQVISA